METRETIRTSHIARSDNKPYWDGIHFGLTDGRIAGFSEQLDKTLRFINNEQPYLESRMYARGYAYALLQQESTHVTP